ncbi:hypothetical protein BDA99DRAFT_523912 [Phascolomyces articulosus]|uniref:F-box domain-containing protein n=1 Tax=Phascolomyces articulosus TaxID=60185 RepID=A0AAD5K0M6_9FUNG|nr:hypothetical protein BDA99DRAFT_523912 [Phascolomyces articulosus]
MTMSKIAMAISSPTPNSFVSVLPFEIREHVINYLNLLDILECLCVCSEWKAKFFPTLVRSIKLSYESKYVHLFEILEKSALQYKTRKAKEEESTPSDMNTTKNTAHHSLLDDKCNIGLYIRHLELHDSFMTAERMDQLVSYCPSLSSLTVHLRIAGDKGGRALLSSELITPEEREKRKSVTSLTSIYIPLLQRLLSPIAVSASMPLINSNNNTLTSLSLFAENTSFSFIDPFYEGIDMSKISSSILCFVPQLEYLVIDIIRLNVSIADMEEIHTICPQLKHLEIRHAIIKQQIRLSSSSSPTTSGLYSQLQLNELHPAHTVTTLVLNFGVWAEDPYIYNNPWFLYIQHKYPFIKNLDIQSSEHSHIQNGIQHNEAIRGSIDRRTHQQVAGERKVATIKLKSYFPNLEQVVIGRFADKTSTSWPRLVQGIPSIILKDDGARDFESWSKSITSMMGTKTNSNINNGGLLKRLVLGILPKNIDGFKYFGHFLHQFYLNGQTFMRGQGRQLLPINILISSCPVMQHLTVKNYLIYYNKNDNNIERIHDNGSPSSLLCSSLLKTMILQHALIMGNNVLTYVGNKCPQLDHLDLIRCAWCSYGDQHPIIRIDMMNHRFKYFRLIKPNTYKSHKKDLPYDAGIIYSPIEMPIETNHYPWKFIDPELSLMDYFLVKRQKNTTNITPSSFSSCSQQQNHQQNVESILFNIKPTGYGTGSSHCIKRLIDGDIVSWLEKDTTTGFKQTKEEERMFHSGPYMGAKKYCSVILYCQDIDQLYYDTIQLDTIYTSYIRTFPDLKL